jgi:hypothetical protein
VEPAREVPLPGFVVPHRRPGARHRGRVTVSQPGCDDPAELERRLSSPVIEGWLQMSLNLMQMSIKTMELQKASLEALRTPATAAPAAPSGRKKP